MSDNTDKNAILKQLAHSFADWFLRKNKTKVEIRELAGEDSGTVVKIYEEGWVGYSKYLFVFSLHTDSTINRLLSEDGLVISEYSEIVLYTYDWLPLRFENNQKFVVFIHQDKIWLGEEGWFSSDTKLSALLNDWLADTTSLKFERKNLIDVPPNALPAIQTGVFIGRSELLADIHKAITSNWQGNDKQPWIFAIYGQGGEGKSYLIKHIQRIYGRRILFTLLDHQNPEQTEDDLIKIIKNLGLELQKAGCPTPTLDDKYKQLLNAKKVRPSLAESGEDIAKGIGKVGKGFEPFGKKSTKTGAMGAANTASMAAGLVGAAGGLLSDVYNVAENIRAKNDEVLKAQPIQELTAALAKDLEIFVEKQKKFYIWRRPVIAFDTYEQLGELADQWLRTLFLPSISKLRPVVLIAGRHDLQRGSTRWSEYRPVMIRKKLGSFSREETEQFLREQKVTDPNRIEAIWQLTEGLPLFLLLNIDAVSRGEAIKEMTGRILEEIDSQYAKVFLDMAVPDGFNRDIIERVYATEKKTNPDEVFNYLRQATFIEIQDDLWRYLPVVRKVLLGYLELESPARLAEIRQRLTINS